MAKFTGATTQSTQKSNPTLDKGVADSILDQLGETVIVEDEVAQAAPVEGEILEGMGGTELTPSAPTYSPQTGVSPEGNVLPLKQRAAMAVEDQLNPNIHTNAAALQRQTPVGRLRGDGSMVGQDSMPLPTYRAKASISPLMSITQRGENMAAGLKDRTISGNWHFHGDDAPVMAQYRKDGVMTEAVKLALEKKRDTNTLAETLTVKVPNAVTIDPADDRYSMNPEFGKLMSLVTENHLHESILAASDKDRIIDEEFDLIDTATADPEYNELEKDINPIEGAAKLGKDIMKWHNATLREQGIQPARPLSNREAKDLGAFALQAFKQSNPEMVAEMRDPEKGGIRYQLTQAGKAEMNRTAASRAEIFNTKLDPWHTRPDDGMLNDSMSEHFTQFKNVKQKNVESITESIKNQSQVNHIPDARRTRLALVSVLPTMYRNPGAKDDHFGEIFGVGETALRQAYMNEHRVKGKSEQDALVTADRIVLQNKRNLLKQGTALVQNYGLPNYIPYAAQQITSRAHAMPSDFNPTRNKVVRFGTRGQAPTKVTKGSRADDGLMTIFALNLLNDKNDVLGDSTASDSLNPRLRIQAARERLPKWADMGRKVKALLDESLPQNTANQMIQAIKNNVALDDPAFPKGAMGQVRKFGDNLPEDVRQLMEDKGEDGLMALESLMEVADYVDNMESKGVHNTFLNGYVDGKTNGIALAAAILGNRELAFRTGILRPDDASYAVQDLDGNAWDVRDAMKYSIQERMDSPNLSYSPYRLPNDISEENRLNFVQVMRDIGGYKALNKNISMVFPYGKELGGMISEVTTHFMDYMADPKNAEFANKVQTLEKAGVKIDDILNAVHYNVITALFDVFGQDTFEGRAMMRTSAALMGIMDVNFAVPTPEGFHVNLSGVKTDLSKKAEGTVKVGKSTLKTQTSPLYRSAAAERDGQIGGSSNRLSVVMPVHAADAMTMHRTFSGKSMEKMKKAYANPEDFYGTQIYDALKVDATNVLDMYDEINKNFMEVAEDFNYFKLAYQEVTSARKKFRDEMMADPNKKYAITPDGRFSFIHDMITPTEGVSASGKTTWTQNGLFTISRSMTLPQKGDTSTDVKNRATANAMKLGDALKNGMPKPNGGRARPLVPTMGRANSEYGNPPKELSGREIVEILDMVFEFTDYSNTQTKFLNRIDGQRKRLFAESREQTARTGWGPSQFHAH